MAHLVEELAVRLWTPGERKPVLAGRLTSEGGLIRLVYDPNFLRLPGAMPIFEGDLPVRSDRRYLEPPNKLPPRCAMRFRSGGGCALTRRRQPVDDRRRCRCGV